MSVARLLASRLRELRQQRGWTQQELADRANLSLNAVNSYERAERFPRAESLDALLSALDVDATQSLGLLGLQSGEAHSEWPSAERRQALSSLQALLEAQPTEFVVLIADLASRISPHFERC